MSFLAQQIVALEMFDGDPGYYVRGHMDKAEFVSEVNVVCDEDFEPEDAAHTYLTETIPQRHVGRYDKPQHGGNPYWWQCKADDPGAFPVTLVRP